MVFSFVQPEALPRRDKDLPKRIVCLRKWKAQKLRRGCWAQKHFRELLLWVGLHSAHIIEMNLFML